MYAIIVIIFSKYMDALTFIVSLIILIMSVVIHELSHGYTAEMLGDPTPRLQGRLTLNPLKHLDLFGSIIVPIITSIAGFTFGWAKPVEWNPYNVKNRKTAELLISLAGPLSNALIAIIFGLIVRFAGAYLSVSLIQIMLYIVGINIVLAVFNLIPVPPLDGSKVLFSLLPAKMSGFRRTAEQYSIFFFLIVILLLWRIIDPIILALFKLITGING